jgi:thermostable 8-oxoguanine DNA glycosylase
MISLKELYKIAKDELSDILPEDNCDFRLEQAEYNSNDKFWEIVVSFLTENINKSTSAFAQLGQNLPYERVYKKLKISDEKKVLGFYIYKQQS